MEISLNSILLSFQTPICFWFYYTASTFLMEQALTGEIENIPFKRPVIDVK
jgi:hypothetical protein